MSFFLSTALLLLFAGGFPLFGWYSLQRAVEARKDSQKLLEEAHAHLRPRETWRVAFSSAETMQRFWKVRCWEDVGVLHLYDDALTYLGEGVSFEWEKSEIEAFEKTVSATSNPWIPWVRVQLKSGLEVFFCTPKGTTVWGMSEGVDAILEALGEWKPGARAALWIEGSE